MYYKASAERYSALVTSGEMTLEAAAQLLSDETNGQLMPIGAADVIANPAEAEKKLVNGLHSTFALMTEMHEKLG